MKKTGNNILDIVQGISNVISQKSFDGALDEEGKEIEIGLKRDKGHKINDSRVMDGFSVTFQNDKLSITYQSDILLKDVSGKKFEEEIEDYMENIKSFIQKEYKKFTGDRLTLTPEKKSIDINVQYLSNVRTFVTAKKWYKISGIETDDIKMRSKDMLNDKMKKWLELGRKEDEQPKNATYKIKDQTEDEKD